MQTRSFGCVSCLGSVALGDSPTIGGHILVNVWPISVVASSVLVDLPRTEVVEDRKEGIFPTLSMLW